MSHETSSNYLKLKERHAELIEAVEVMGKGRVSTLIIAELVHDP